MPSIIKLEIHKVKLNSYQRVFGSNFIGTLLEQGTLMCLAPDSGFVFDFCVGDTVL
jgi:hypothetical protein